MKCAKVNDSIQYFVSSSSVRYVMFAVGGTFKALSAVAFFFAWKFYKLPADSPTDDSIPEVGSQTTIIDGPDAQEKMTDAIKLSPPVQLIRVSDSAKEKAPSFEEDIRITNV